MHLGRKYFGMFVSISMTAMTLFVVTPIASAQSQLRTGFYAYVAKGDAEAVRIKANFLKQMESKDPRNPTLPILSANSLFQDEAYEEAIEASRRAIIIDDHDYRSWWFLATSLEKIGRREEALEARKRTIELSPFNITNLLELGKNQVSVGDLSSARNTLAQMAEIAPGSAEVQELTNLTQQTP
jgi:tetratricopeptide (TPR) repeat protein